MVFKVIDIETTGLDPKSDRIVEIASVDLSEDYCVMNPREDLVNPLCQIPPEASAIHHLTDADVSNAMDIDHVLPFYKDKNAIYVAHNAAFERLFLKKLGNVRWLCTYKAAIRVWPDAPNHSNQVLRYWLNLNIDKDIGMPHRALPDCLVTVQILIKLLENASVDDMIQWTNMPILLKTCNFGKHNGTPWSDVPKDYLQWLINQSSFDENTVYTAKFYLNR